MVSLKRKYIRVDKDLRLNPRIEFHVPVSVMGINAKAEVVDFSTGGFFVQIDAVEMLKKGQRIRLALRFPHEKKITIIKAKIVRIESNGFGCQFVDLDPLLGQLIETNFEIFSSTLPIK
jgi:hypothetical protein